MKRTTIALFLTITLGFFAQANPYTINDEPFEVLKGRVVDKNHDGIWDGLTFFVETEGTCIDIPVISVDILLGDGTIISDVKVRKCRDGGSIAMYQVKLKHLGVVGDFEVRLTLDTSLITSASVSIRGGPGSKPNETIFIIKYP
jgi:hypothetical protein